MADQCKGNFLVMKNGTVIPDPTDYGLEFDILRKKFPEKRSFTVWDIYKDDDSVKYVACLWELESGAVKACVSDREHNNMEIGGATIELVAALMDSAHSIIASMTAKQAV